MKGLAILSPLLLLPLLAASPVPHPQSGGTGRVQRRAANGCATGQDLIAQALERLQANSPASALQEADQLLRRAIDLCSESGEAWYYRSIVESRMGRTQLASYALRQAQLFPSDALRDGLNPFILSTPPPSHTSPLPPIQQRWALVIGIGDFSDKRIPKLDYTTADATDFQRLLIDPKRGGFPPDHVRLLVDTQANLVEVKKAINWLARSAGKDDLAVVYIASHGSERQLDTVGANYILAHDTELDPQHVDPDSLYATALPMIELANAVATRVRALRTAVFLDTCYSGGAITAASKTASSVLSASVSQSTLDHIRQGSGRVIFSASQVDQESLESPELKHGYFTYFLVQALTEQPKAPLSQIFAYVQQHVAQQVDKDYAIYDMHQSPVLSQSSPDADFPLGAPAAQLAAKEPLPIGGRR